MALTHDYPDERLVLVTEQKIESYEVDAFLHNSIGPHYHDFVELTFNFTKRVTKENDGQADGPAYRGGEWSFYSLSNGGLYMLPPMHQAKSIRARLDTNGADVFLSNQAIGLAASSFALSNMAFILSRKELHDEGETVIEAFHNLRDYYLQHPESFEISLLLD